MRSAIEAVDFGGRRVGPDEPCFIIAEAGVNHDGSMDRARELIDRAAEAGVDAVKFQAFITEELITPEAPKAGYQVETTGKPGSQRDMLKALELGEPQQARLKAHCDERGLIYLCTPYDHQSIDMLDRIDTVGFKIASTDTVNVPLLRHLASKGRPAILSTGMSSLAEVEQGIDALHAGGLAGKIAVLQCTSEYPAPIEQVNLRAIQTLERAFGLPVGFSDHTPGIGASPWAIPLGACIIEKHFTLDRCLPGPDHRASIEPDELCELVATIRNVEAALGDGVKRALPSELQNKPKMQKSVVARQPIAAGTEIAAAALTCKRPGTGLPPLWLDRIAGRKAAVDIAADTILELRHVDWT